MAPPVRPLKSLLHLCLVLPHPTAARSQCHALCRADKLILWRARDLLHSRSITIGRFWYKGQLTSLKIDAMRRLLLPRLDAALRLHLSGRAVHFRNPMPSSGAVLFKI